MRESYIQYATGYQKDNVNFYDVEKALNKILEMDDEHASFWVSVVTENENVIEVHKSKKMYFYFDDGSEFKYMVKNWEEALSFFRHLWNKNFDTIKALLV